MGLSAELHHPWVQCETNKLFSLFVIWVVVSKSGTQSVFNHLFTIVCPWLEREQKRRSRRRDYRLALDLNTYTNP